jgi:hypothetical protein
MISGLAILHSEMAEAEALRLECSVQQDCHILNRGYTSCTPTNPVVSLLVEIDLESNTWVEIFTSKDGTQTGASGKLRSVTQYEFVLDETSYTDGKTEHERISRTSGAYSYVQRFVRQNLPMEVTWSGSCKKTTKPLPSAKF